MASQRVESLLSRGPIARLVLAIVVALATMFPTIVEAEAAAQKNYRIYAGIVVDGKTGKVLYEEAADATRYPASVTKVMTLYILFQELTAGNIKLSTKMTVSSYAASAVPTKLGLKAGSTITVEDAIKAIVTLSANDMARVIAEHISGSESKFAQRMTATARALGMSRTQYVNASGLPDGRQTTTVRDQARLAVAIYQHFPKYYEYFQTKSFSYGKRVYGNHNRLLGASGIDGIKTGYINNSGYNLMTASRKDNHHLIVIGFGFNTSRARDAKVYELVQKYLPKSRSGGYLQTAMIPAPGIRGGYVGGSAPDIQVAASEEPVFVTPAALPSFRTAVAALPAAPAAVPAVQPAPAPEVQVASVRAPVPQDMPADLTLQPAVQAANLMGAPSAVQPANPPVDVIGAWISETFSLGAPPAPLGQTQASEPLVPPVGVGQQGQPIDLMTSGSVSNGKPVQVASADANDVVAPAAPLSVKKWIVQVGATPSQDGANDLINDAAARISTLADFRASVEPFEKNGQTFYRARFVGFGDRDGATQMCNQLKAAKMSCLAMQS
ncbi:penicillin-binding protein [Youhaiella tibetensis]|nr:D-alanyl-D-alanine carboxypeptidase [Devosia sp. H5989]GGF18542.1 penicillin-binding protein [Youhaiella tibetensis]